MKLFAEAHLFDGVGQGSRTFLQGVYNSAFNKDRETTFALGAFKPEVLRAEFGDHENVKFIKYKSKNKFFRLAYDIPNIIRREKIDAAHFTYVSPLIKTCYELVNIHDVLFLDFPKYFPLDYRMVKNYLFKKSALRADCVLTISQWSKAALNRHYNIPAEKIVVTPCGVLEQLVDSSPGDPSIIEKNGLSSFILYVSRFEPRKNHDGLLRAYAALELWKKNIPLVFVGSKDIPIPAFDALYASLPEAAKKCVFMFHGLTVAQIKSLYAKCLLFVYPSFAEGFGIPPVEAAACGASVLCSNATSLGELTFFGDRLFDPNDDDEFRDKLKHYVESPASAEERARINNVIKSEYTWDRAADIFLKQLPGKN